MAGHLGALVPGETPTCLFRQRAEGGDEGVTHLAGRVSLGQRDQAEIAGASVDERGNGGLAACAHDEVALASKSHSPQRKRWADRYREQGPSGTRIAPESASRAAGAQPASPTCSASTPPPCTSTQPMPNRPAMASGPHHRSRSPTIRARRTRRLGTCRHQEARQHTGRRRPSGPGRSGRSQEPDRRRLQLHPPRRRRPLPPGLQRDPHRREEGDRLRILGPRAELLRPGRDLRPARPDRQRLLPSLARVVQHPGRRRNHPQTHRPYRPQTNGKAERFNRLPAVSPASRVYN